MVGIDSVGAHESQNRILADVRGFDLQDHIAVAVGSAGRLAAVASAIAGSCPGKPMALVMTPSMTVTGTLLRDGRGCGRSGGNAVPPPPPQPAINMAVLANANSSREGVDFMDFL